MGIHSCSGPIRKKELLTVMLGGELVMGGGSWEAPVPSQYKMLKCGVSLMRHSVCEEYTQFGYSLYSLLLRLVKLKIKHWGVDR